MRVFVQFLDGEAGAGDEAARSLLWPAKKSEDAAGYDLVAANPTKIEIAPGAFAKIGTGIALELPKGTFAEVRPRSGLAAKHGVTVLNAPGTIDADYRGEVGVLLINHGATPFVVERGLRIAQLVIRSLPEVSLEVATALSETERGAGGFGSTGRF